MAFRKVRHYSDRPKSRSKVDIVLRRLLAVSSILGVIGLSDAAGTATPGSISSTHTQVGNLQVETLPSAAQSEVNLLPASKPASLVRSIASNSPQNPTSSQRNIQTSSQHEVQTARSANSVQPSKPVAQAVVLPIPQGASKKDFLQHHDQGSAQQLLAPPQPLDQQVVAQNSSSSSSQDSESLRQRLLIDPLVELRAPAYSPGSSVGIPTGFGANYGDAFVGISFSNRRPRVNEADGAMSVGFGLGDSQKAVGLEVSANIGSLRRFARNGDLGFKLHRALPGRAAIAIGWDSGITWGEENRSTVSTVYGVGSKVFELRPGNPDNTLPLTVSLGVGGGRFRSFDNIQNRKGGVGVFGGVGLQVAPQVSVSSSWTGQDLNFGVSYVPIRTTPLFLTAVVANVLNRNDNATLFSFGIGYGFNYSGYQY
jgi:hypothetical protein